MTALTVPVIEGSGHDYPIEKYKQRDDK